jgi:methyl-accepting chemotaxis protein
MQQNTKLSVAIVSETVSQANHTKEVFRNIMEMVNHFSLKVNEIAAASQETAATSQTLAQLAENLNESVALFRTSKE